jgi:hypothetical protein
MARAPEKAINLSMSQELPYLCIEPHGLLLCPPVPTTSKSTQFTWAYLFKLHSYLDLVPQNCFVLSCSINQNSVCNSCVSCACYVPYPTHPPPQFHHPNIAR